MSFGLVVILLGSLSLLLPDTQRCWGLPQHRKWMQRLEGRVCGKSRDQIGSTPVKITEMRACMLYFLANMLQPCLAVTCTVMGADAGGEGLTGPRKHPFFMLGAKLGPDDPRGGAWFTYQAHSLTTPLFPLPSTVCPLQVTLIPTRTRNALNFLFTCIPQAVRWCMSSKDRTQENESASPTAVAADADMNGGAVPAKATNRKMGKDAHVSAASKAAAAAVHKDMVSDDVRAASITLYLVCKEVEMVEELWDLVVPPQPGQQTHSLAEMEQQQQHGSNSLTTTSPNQRGGGRSVLTESTVMPVLLLRGVRKEFQLPQSYPRLESIQKCAWPWCSGVLMRPFLIARGIMACMILSFFAWPCMQPFKLPKAPDLHNTLGLCGKEGNKDDRQQEWEQKQLQHNGASRLAAPANEHAAQHDSPASQNSGVPRCVEGAGEEGSVARQVVGSRKQGLGAIGKVAAAPPASKSNVKIAVAVLWLSVRKAECFGLLGPNGAGKTTALRLMQGLLEPSAGRVAVCGKDLETEPQAASRLTGICPQVKKKTAIEILATCITCMRDRIKGEGWGASPVNRVKRQELKEFRSCPAFLVGLKIQCLH
eukprot:1161937-Pelagomonas_calceolata.AAC.6